METGDGDRTSGADAEGSSDGDAAGATDGSATGRDARESNPSGPAPGDGGLDLDDVTGTRRSLDPRVQVVWVAQSLVSADRADDSADDGGLFGIGDFRPGLAAFGLAFVLGSAHAVLRYRVWRYEVRERSLYLEHGVFTRVKTVVPYVRIQHVDASRGPVERLFGLATSVVYTAGSRGADVSIPGLTSEGAEDLQRRLERLAIAAESEDAV